MKNSNIRYMPRTVRIVLELPVTGKAERVTVRGPLQERELCIRMLEEAIIAVKESANGGAVLLPDICQPQAI